ncbi:uncharacterized protein LOC115007027, partial [Cottoperca gobio]|uniref:ribonuclease H n=1 Tax=Cottoperca gobio TaxID=56716 RepID=A0A6J2PJL0_COTGO
MTSSGDCAILILLDLSTDFDTVDYDILIDSLHYRVGVDGTALSWFTAYLKNRSFSINMGNFSSVSHKVSVTCPALPCPAMPCLALPCPALPYPALLCSAHPVSTLCLSHVYLNDLTIIWTQQRFWVVNCMTSHIPSYVSMSQKPELRSEFRKFLEEFLSLPLSPPCPQPSSGLRELSFAELMLRQHPSPAAGPFQTLTPIAGPPQTFVPAAGPPQTPIPVAGLPQTPNSAARPPQTSAPASARPLQTPAVPQLPLETPVPVLPSTLVTPVPVPPSLLEDPVPVPPSLLVTPGQPPEQLCRPPGHFLRRPPERLRQALAWPLRRPPERPRLPPAWLRPPRLPSGQSCPLRRPPAQSCWPPPTSCTDFPFQFCFLASFAPALLVRVLLVSTLNLDDILIFSKTHTEHTHHVQLVLRRLLENSLFVKAEKCEFHAKSVSFLGYVVTEGSVQMDPAKVSAVMSWPVPETRKKLQQFLGFANFYRRFIRGYSTVAAPLTALTSVKQPFQWTAVNDKAFKTLKARFTSGPILQMPDAGRQFVVEVDASDVGVGAVLSQRAAEDGKMHPCAFYSRRLTPAECNYDIGNRELLAVKLALEEWRHWLEGSKVPFVVWTDHKNLEYIQTARRLNSRQRRW